MNKKEAIEKIKKLEGLTILDKTINLDSEMILKKRVLNIVKQLDEPQKPVVPKFVAEWIEYCKSNKLTLFGAFDPVSEHGIGLANTFTGVVWKGIDWAKRNQETFARAWLDGYEVEEEKKYRVILKGNSESPDYLVDTVTNGFHFYNNIYANKREHTRKELEANGFGWVFDCDGIEVEEVEE